MIVPDEALPILQAIAPAFTRPTCQRFALLMGAALLCTGRRAVANLLRVAAPLADGHVTSYQRVFSSASWSAMQLACYFRRLVVALLPDQPILLAGDDTVDGHPGKHVYGKARHRDPVRSSHSHTAWRHGHKWVVLAVLVRFPFASRAWASPILIDLYRSPEDDRRRKRPHRTQAQLMCRLPRLMRIRFPDRSYVFVGDAGDGAHEAARFRLRRRGRLALVGKLHPEANLCEPPPPYRGNGRPPAKGARRLKPGEAVSAARRVKRLTVAWCGGAARWVEAVAGDGHWCKSGHGLAPIRWVFVRDRDGARRDEYFFTTDPAMGAAAIIGHCTSRRNIETTFQEPRSHLGLETTRGWSRSTVLRAAPCLSGLYSVAAVLYQALPEGKSNATGLKLSVCHLPPGTSKWNKSEHRMFRHITQNWRGRPLRSLEIIVSLIGGTTTGTGLSIRAELDAKPYPKGIVVSDEELAAVRMRKASFHGEWNYTISPRKGR